MSYHHKHDVHRVVNDLVNLRRAVNTELIEEAQREKDGRLRFLVGKSERSPLKILDGSADSFRETPLSKGGKASWLRTSPRDRPGASPSHRVNSFQAYARAIRELGDAEQCCRRAFEVLDQGVVP